MIENELQQLHQEYITEENPRDLNQIFRLESNMAL